MTPQSVGIDGWLRSVPSAAGRLAAGDIRCVDDLVGAPLTMPDGRSYVPFRHTRKVEALWGPTGEPAVLHPRFALPGFEPRRRALHRLFRTACIVTTPFFVGLDGFRSKLWMVDPATGDFAGLYEWDDVDGASAYGAGLDRVLRLLAVPGSVTYDVVPARSFDEYLAVEAR
jgi:hypothetical protein